ncbi:N-alpha-acetyltransferase 38, NatC auxiliary subunit [Cytospora mali]|uniref:N-alpha-acetyltransferase 38, NatC auxiliary subunit n=1 Tax=Cytospora mali TaxID=578113 RepID=A0A194V903_CYTMA|nr:N-alpha-acetyltransferase 38, NatC auxiliary subunit [Valsa mali var. pyri (nom. inval.)]
MATEEDKMTKAEGQGFLESLLNNKLRIHTTDERMFWGDFKCTDPDRNIVLAHTYEYRQPSAQQVAKAAQKAGTDAKSIKLDMMHRYLGLIVVPGEHIVRIEKEDFDRRGQSSAAPGMGRKRRIRISLLVNQDSTVRPTGGETGGHDIPRPPRQRQREIRSGYDGSGGIRNNRDRWLPGADMRGRRDQGPMGGPIPFYGSRNSILLSVSFPVDGSSGPCAAVASATAVETSKVRGHDTKG